jgi:photosystem II stability/assembly factor-like uncharacterized protein
MKRFITNVLNVALFFFSYSMLNVNAQWIQTNGPAGGEVNALAADGSDAYVIIKGGGMYRSTDYGSSWERCQECANSVSNNTSKLIVRGDTVIATQYSPFILVCSTDRGNTWNNITNPFSIGYISFLDFAGSDIYVHAPPSIFRSADLGHNWELLNDLPFTRITALTAWGSNILAGNNGLFLSSDNGTTWIQIKDNDPEEDCKFILAVENKIYYASWYGLFFSPDTGTTWERIFPHPVSDVTIYNNSVYIQTPLEKFKVTTDNGISWSAIKDGLYITNYSYKMAVSGNRILAGGYGCGVLKLNFGDTTWTDANNGLYASNIYEICVKGNTLFAATLGWGAARSTDNGNTWVQCINGLTTTRLLSIGTDGEYIYAGSWGGGIFRSGDEGQTWEEVNNGYSASNANSFLKAGSRFFAGPSTSYPVCVTTDNGLLWTTVSELSNGSLDFAKDGNIIYSVGRYVYKSTDEGVSWSTLNKPTTKTINAVAVKGDFVYLGAQGEGFRSTDGGNTWVKSDSGLGIPNFSDLIYIGDYLIAAVSGGVYWSSDNGLTWTKNNSGFIPFPRSFLLKDNLLFVGTAANGIWYQDVGSVVPVELTSFSGRKKGNIVLLNWTTSSELNNRGFELHRRFQDMEWRTLSFINGNSTTTAVQHYSYTDDLSEILTILPEDSEIFYRLMQIDYDGSFKYSSELSLQVKREYSCSLNQNYPNPFNPSTTIEYSVAGEGKVILSIYDLLGRELIRLVDEEKQNGSYETTWDAYGFPSGVYFIKLQSGQFSDMRKILLMK